jgi:hypothetical protein
MYPQTSGPSRLLAYARLVLELGMRSNLALTRLSPLRFRALGPPKMVLKRVAVEIGRLLISHVGVQVARPRVPTESAGQCTQVRPLVAEILNQYVPL